MPKEPLTQLEQWDKEYDSHSPEYRAEGLATETITQVIDKLDEAAGGNRSWLAEALGVSRQQVSAMLNAPPNLTLLSIAKLSIALGTRPRILFDSHKFVIRSISETWSLEDVDLERCEKRMQSLIQATQGTNYGGGKEPKKAPENISGAAAGVNDDQTLAA